MIDDEHHAGDVEFARRAVLARLKGGDALEAAALGSQLRLIELRGLAMGEVVADFADEVDVGVKVGPDQAHAIRQVRAGAERLQGPAWADQAVDGIGVVHQGGAEHQVQGIVQKCRPQESHAAVGLAREVLDQPGYVVRQVRQSLQALLRHVFRGSEPS